MVERIGIEDEEEVRRLNEEWLMPPSHPLRDSLLTLLAPDFPYLRHVEQELAGLRALEGDEAIEGIGTQQVTSITGRCVAEKCADSKPLQTMVLRIMNRRRSTLMQCNPLGDG
ncbi:hypothetical protein Tco_1506926 [Tanacetum coccineum]